MIKFNIGRIERIFQKKSFPLELHVYYIKIISRKQTFYNLYTKKIINIGLKDEIDWKFPLKEN